MILDIGQGTEWWICPRDAGYMAPDEIPAVRVPAGSVSSRTVLVECAAKPWR